MQKDTEKPKNAEELSNSFEIVTEPLALTKNDTLEESLKELDQILQAELLSFDKVKNLLFVFETYYLGSFTLENDKTLEANDSKKEDNFPNLKNIELKDESKKEWVKRKAVAGVFNVLILMTEALESLEKMDFFSKGGPLFFARESARLFAPGKSGGKSRLLQSLGKYTKVLYFLIKIFFFVYYCRFLFYLIISTGDIDKHELFVHLGLHADPNMLPFYQTHPAVPPAQDAPKNRLLDHPDDSQKTETQKHEPPGHQNGREDFEAVLRVQVLLGRAS